ncbi:MAG: hypothetical protein QXS21_07130 [Thermoproteota archaeon]
MPKISVKNETKEEKFKRVASARTLRILDDLRLLGNCANTSTYSYSEEDVNKIFLAIEKEFKRVKNLFNKAEIRFSLE